MKMTPARERALLTAFSDEYSLDEDAVNPRTLRSLLDAGWLQSGDEELLITDCGRRALGVHVPPSGRPKRMITAIRRAVRTLFDDVEVLRRDQTSPPAYDEGELDWSDVVAVAQTTEYYYAHLDEDEDVRWDAAATMVSEMGFPCYAEVFLGHVTFRRDE